MYQSKSKLHYTFGSFSSQYGITISNKNHYASVLFLSNQCGIFKTDKPLHINTYPFMNWAQQISATKVIYNVLNKWYN